MKGSLTLAMGAVTLVTLAGCVSAGDPQSRSAAASINPTPGHSARCDLFTTSDLQGIFDKPFSEARLDPASTETESRCQWAARDQEALVLTRAVGHSAKSTFEQSKRVAERTLGVVTDVQISGSTAAYQIASQRRITVLAGHQMIDVSILIPAVTQQQQERAAEVAVRHALSSARSRDSAHS